MLSNLNLILISHIYPLFMPFSYVFQLHSNRVSKYSS